MIDCLWCLLTASLVLPFLSLYFCLPLIQLTMKMAQVLDNLRCPCRGQISFKDFKLMHTRLQTEVFGLRSSFHLVQTLWMVMLCKIWCIFELVQALMYFGLCLDFILLWTLPIRSGILGGFLIVCSTFDSYGFDGFGGACNSIYDVLYEGVCLRGFIATASYI